MGFVEDIISGVTTPVKALITDAFDKLTSSMNTLNNVFKTGLSDLSSNFTSTFNSLKSSLSNGFSDITDGIGNFAKGLKDGITSVLSGIIDELDKLVSPLVDTLVKIADSLANLGSFFGHLNTLTPQDILASVGEFQKTMSGSSSTGGVG